MDSDDCDEGTVREAKRQKVYDSANREDKTVDLANDVGTIARVELVNFMYILIHSRCHSVAEVKFGSKINFLVGHNGSGKSAILTGLTVCLGGNAKFTNRASSFKGLIKEGTDVASVTVVLRNKGADAYRRIIDILLIYNLDEIFGDTITIVKEFGREKASTVKIKSSNGKVVETTAREVKNICDHMQIEVDNPMAILTQDTARQFLANSTPADKYKFFLKGTQLEKLMHEYEMIDEKLDTCATILNRKREQIPEIEAEVAELDKKWHELEEARNLEIKISNLHKEKFWAGIQDYEAKIRDKEAILEDKASRIKNHALKADEALVSGLMTLGIT